MYSGWAFIDVDGTLIDQNDNPRPYVSDLVSRLYDLNLIVVIWSGGGSKYAESKFNMICRRISNFEMLKKIREYRWKGDPIQWDHIRPVFFVDDSESLLDYHIARGCG